MDKETEKPKIDFQKFKDMTDEIKLKLTNLQNDLNTLKTEFKPFVPVATDIYKIHKSDNKSKNT